MFLLKEMRLQATECLQRAFEVALNYAVYYKKAGTKLLRLRYDTEMLVTGKKSKKSLAEKYEEEKARGKSEGKLRVKSGGKTNKPVARKAYKKKLSPILSSFKMLE